MIKGFIFDFNGVMTEADWYWSLLAERVPDLDNRRDEFSALSDEVDLGRTTSDEFKDKVADRLGITRTELNKFRSNIHNSPSYIRADLVKLIEQLHGQYKIALVSNYSSEHLRPQIEQYNLAPLFDQIVISSEVGYVKPSPEIFHYTLDALGLSADEVVFVDDRAEHVEAAQAVGITSVVFTDTKSFIDFLHEQGIDTV